MGWCTAYVMTQGGRRAVLHFICALMNEADMTHSPKIVQCVFQINDSCTSPYKLVACRYGTYSSRWRSSFAQARYSLPLTTSH
jgi:hypothetical protein